MIYALASRRASVLLLGVAGAAVGVLQGAYNTYKNAYTHTRIHTYILTYIHTYLHTYISEKTYTLDLVQLKQICPKLRDISRVSMTVWLDPRRIGFVKAVAGSQYTFPFFFFIGYRSVGS